MTEQQAAERFERRLGERLRAYTNVATATSIDPVDVARLAMSARTGQRWSRRPSIANLLTWRLAAIGAALIVAVVGLGIVIVQRRGTDVGQSSSPTTSPGPASSTTGLIPNTLRHPWQRALPIAGPGSDPFASGYLGISDDELRFGRSPDLVDSTSAITFVGLDSLVVTSTDRTAGCEAGQVGNYGWVLQGKDTAMTLTAIGPDACSKRQSDLSGFWVRADLTGSGNGVTLAPGQHVSTGFDPFGDAAAPSRLSFAVPEDWRLEEDLATTFVLHHVDEPPASPPDAPADTLIAIMAEPRMAAESPPDSACGPGTEAPGVGHSVDDLLAAIAARPGLLSSSPRPIAIGGFAGQMVDLQMDPSWTGGCRDGTEKVVGIQLLLPAGTNIGPVVGVATDHPTRIILLGLPNGRTLCVVVFSIDRLQPAQFAPRVAQVMPIIESFRFVPAGP